MIKRELNRMDLVAWNRLQKFKEESECLDKQVACIITDGEGDVLSYGVNRVHECDQNCHDKEHRLCTVTHAEVDAIRKLAVLGQGGWRKPYRAYVNLFPCVPCQLALDRVVEEIVAFGTVHKAPESKKLIVVPEPPYYRDGTESDALMTLIRTFGRVQVGHMRGVPTESMAVADLELALDRYKLAMWGRDREFYNKLRNAKAWSAGAGLDD